MTPQRPRSRSLEDKANESAISDSVYCVIMAGGKGTRLWPESRKDTPKQFLTFGRSNSLLEETVARISHLIPVERILIATDESLADKVRQTLPFLPESNILTEPVGRNTAPCLGRAALELLARDKNAVMVVLPCDHDIHPDDVFLNTIRFAIELVRDDSSRLITIGINPTRPSPEFGYIEAGEKLTPDLFHVRLFHEKPDIARAAEYIERGNFFWNAGIFVWNAGTILDELQKNEPDLAESFQRMRKGLAHSNYPVVVAAEFTRMKSISIDFAVLERSKNVYVIKAAFEWSDLGSFQALSETGPPPDEDSNSITGQNVICIDSQNNIIRLLDDKNKRLLALLGIEDLIVVQTETVTLLCHKGDERSIPRILEKLKENDQKEYL